MGGETQKTTTSTTAPANPDVNPTLSMLLKGVQGAYQANPQGQYFDKSMYAGTGPTTKSAWAMGKDAAINPAFSEGMGGAIDSYSKVARGDYLNNMDPEYQAMIDRSANQTAADINASMGADGRYGSNVHVGALADEIGALRTGANVENRRYEQARQQSAAQMLPELLSGNQLPASLMGQYGSFEDADRQAALQGEADLFARRTGAPTDQLAKLSSILAGNAGSGGSTTSNTQPVAPLWQQLLGYVAGNAGQAMRYGG